MKISLRYNSIITEHKPNIKASYPQFYQKTNLEKIISNTQYKNVLDRKIKIFKNDFFEFFRLQFTKADGNLNHPGEFGALRENLCKDLFRSIIQNSSKGIYAYNHGSNLPLIGSPIFNQGAAPVTSFLPANDENTHIKHFLTNLQVFTMSATVFHPDMANYLN